jgi:hypothetical protein
MESTALATVDTEVLSVTNINPAEYFKPQISVREAIERQAQLAELVSKMLIPSTSDQWGNVKMDGADYGTIPGTKNRCLFQPGAEKLALFFGLTVTTYCEKREEDWTGGFFRYTFKATASYKGQVIREVTRTCHTREKKYAWIWVTRTAPDKATQQEMIEAQTARWGSAWENRKKVTVWQERKPNPDPFSLQFVVEAMAQKRAKVAVVKEALAATGYFATEVDFEDMHDVPPGVEAYDDPARNERVRKEAQQAAASKKGDSGGLKTAPAEDAGAPDGPTKFWAAVNVAGIKREDAQQDAAKAAAGEITWEQAIANLPK